MTTRGAFDRLIVVQRGVPTTDSFGGETLEWADIQQAWARVRFGQAGELRAAAQEGGLQSATFEVRPTEALLGAGLKDRILWGGVWDITEVAPLERDLLRFTAVRAL